MTEYIECSHGTSSGINAISTRYNHQIFHNMVLDFELCWHSILEKLLYFDIQPTMWICSFIVQSTKRWCCQITYNACISSKYKAAMFNIYDSKNDIKNTNVNTAADWTWRDPLDYIHELGSKCIEAPREAKVVVVWLMDRCARVPWSEIFIDSQSTLLWYSQEVALNYPECPVCEPSHHA